MGKFGPVMLNFCLKGLFTICSFIIVILINLIPNSGFRLFFCISALSFINLVRNKYFSILIAILSISLNAFSDMRDERALLAVLIDKLYHIFIK
ncbi:hypothetical protein EGI32_21310 [Ferruginibacter sp. HRS2-29]|nr:hypothetical protein [Ferruginibacter sp. HRS2-29]